MSTARKNTMGGVLQKINTSKLPDNQKESLRQELLSISTGLVPQNKFDQVMTKVNQALN